MSERMQILEEIYPLMVKYTEIEPRRPSLMDLLTYDMLIDMHEFDSLGDEFTWNDTPDHIMEKIIESGPVFDMEFGLEDLNEQVRNYLITNDLIVDPTNNEEK